MAYATPLMTPNVSPSIRSSNCGRLASSTGPTWRIASPTTGTSTATSRNVPSAGVPPPEPSRDGAPNDTGPRSRVQTTVQTIASTPVRPKARPVTGSGSSSQRFTSYM